MQHEAPPDPAAEAFKMMEARLALLQRAIEGLAAERNALPDYRPAIESMAAQQQGLTQALKKIDASPGMQVTHEMYSAGVERATERLRRYDRATIETAARAMTDSAAEFTNQVRSARNRAAQNDALIWAWVLGMGAAGGLLALARAITG
ncbi:hypothetical protein GON01_06470 [Sphingomonas sp. MAH-20]|uniref:Uncharacterized protein n=1 Tax=Sphingomonas horti TaxID=2682842 RepID=A0A6I4IZI1_9SPHN|nr:MULTISPECIES: DUF6118 family protein [Sphingomonas]MBA2920641.1 hypothetical protein [Sphingomonas sp. CGMCC 1.13658]MVO77577.1 hypothetical protein [Sphingomonas horti]